MPNSTPFFKKQILEFIDRNIPKDARVLDVGAGSGIWANCMPEYTNIHAIEIFENYVEQFSLEAVYAKVIVGNVIEQTREFFQEYDLIIMGDVVEHMSHEDALSVISRIPDTTTVMIGVPWGPQGVHNDNIYEIHIQDKLTNLDFLKLYPTYDLFGLHHGYAIYFNRSILTSDEYLYTVDVPEEQREWVIANYPDRKIVNLDDTDHMIDYTLYGYE